MKSARTRKILATLLIFFGLTLAFVTPAYATAPKIKDVEYGGNGKVEVDFSRDVHYKKAKVTVRDTSGKTYKATIVNKDEDDLTFKIRKFKKNRTYRFTISGVKVRGTGKFGKVSSKVKIPAATAQISKSAAISIATNHAKSTWGASRITHKEADKDTHKGIAIWEVSFEGTIGNRRYEFEYDINRLTGKIVRYEHERD